MFDVVISLYLKVRALALFQFTPLYGLNLSEVQKYPFFRENPEKGVETSISEARKYPFFRENPEKGVEISISEAQKYPFFRENPEKGVETNSY